MVKRKGTDEYSCPTPPAVHQFACPLISPLLAKTAHLLPPVAPLHFRSSLHAMLLALSLAGCPEMQKRGEGGGGVK